MWAVGAMAPCPLISKGDLKLLLALELEGPYKIQGLGEGLVIGKNEDCLPKGQCGLVSVRVADNTDAHKRGHEVQASLLFLCYKNGMSQRGAALQPGSQNKEVMWTDAQPTQAESRAAIDLQSTGNVSKKGIVLLQVAEALGSSLRSINKQKLSDAASAVENLEKFTCNSKFLVSFENNNICHP